MPSLAIVALFLSLHATPVTALPAVGLPAMQTAPPPSGSAEPAAPEVTQAPAPPAPRVTAYTLPPATYQKARHLAQIALWGQIAGFLYSVAILLWVLKNRWSSAFRDVAERSAKNRFLQAAIFTPLWFASLAVLGIPLDIGEHWVSRKFGLSVQGWGSWFWDWTKGQGITILLGIFLVWILYSVIRASPRRWWFYFWLISLPIAVFLVFLQPLVVDPLFNKFEPLQQKDPALATALEAMVQHAGQNIPVDKMFWMAASQKTNSLNAYVTGIGASKRIVVWDTTIAKMNTQQTVFVAGHEMGHYVLNHLPKGMGIVAVILLVLFYLEHRSLGWLLASRGAAWDIRGLGDWASLPVILLLLTIFVFLANPVFNGSSRYFEHQADQYGLEVTHALTPDSSQVAAQAFQILGEVDLSDPAPDPLDVFLFYSHPTDEARIRFSLDYDPWANGGHGEFVP